MCVCLCAAHSFACDCSEESKSEGFEERTAGGRDGKQLGGKGGESRDSEKSISAEYLIKFKPSDLSLLPGAKASRDAGVEKWKSCRKGKRG